MGFAVIHLQMSCHLLRAFREGHAVLLRGHVWLLKDLLEHTPSIFNQMVSYWSNQCRGAPERFVLCCVQQQPANQIPIACQVPAVLGPTLPFCHPIFLAALWNGYYNPRLTTGKLETQRCKLDAYSPPPPRAEAVLPPWGPEAGVEKLKDLTFWFLVKVSNMCKIIVLSLIWL